MNITRSCFEDYKSRYGRKCKKFVVSELSKSSNKLTAGAKGKKSCSTSKNRETKYHLLFRPLITCNTDNTKKRSKSIVRKKTEDTARQTVSRNFSLIRKLENFVMSNGFVSTHHKEENQNRCVDGRHKQEPHDRNEIIVWQGSSNHNIARQHQILKPSTATSKDDILTNLCKRRDFIFSFPFENIMHPENVRKNNVIQAVDRIFATIRTFDERSTCEILCKHHSCKEKNSASQLDLPSLKIEKSESNIREKRKDDTLETEEPVIKNGLLQRQFNERNEVMCKNLYSSKPNSIEPACKCNLQEEKFNVEIPCSNYLDRGICLEQGDFTYQQTLQLQSSVGTYKMTFKTHSQQQISEEIAKRKIENNGARIFSIPTSDKCEDSLMEQFEMQFKEGRDMINNRESEKKRLEEQKSTFVTNSERKEKVKDVINELDLCVNEFNTSNEAGCKNDLQRQKLNLDRIIKCENDLQMSKLNRNTEAKCERNNRGKEVKALINIFDENICPSDAMNQFSDEKTAVHTNIVLNIEYAWRTGQPGNSFEFMHFPVINSKREKSHLEDRTRLLLSDSKRGVNSSPVACDISMDSVILENSQHKANATEDSGIFSFTDESVDANKFILSSPTSDSSFSIKKSKRHFFSQPLNKRKKSGLHGAIGEPANFSIDDEFYAGETFRFKKVKYEKDYSEFGTSLTNCNRPKNARSFSFSSDKKIPDSNRCAYSLRSSETLKLSSRKVLSALQSLNNSMKRPKSFSGSESSEFKTNEEKSIAMDVCCDFLNERCAALYLNEKYAHRPKFNMNKNKFDFERKHVRRGKMMFIESSRKTYPKRNLCSVDVLRSVDEESLSEHNRFSNPSPIIPSFVHSEKENCHMKDLTFCSENNESTKRLCRNSESSFAPSNDVRLTVPCKTKNNVMKYIDAFKKLKRKTSKNVCGVVKRNFMRVRNADCKKYSQLADDYFDDFTHMIHRSLMKQPDLDLWSDKENQIEYHSSPRVRHVCRRKPNSYHNPELGASIILSALPEAEKLRIGTLHKDRRLLLQKYEALIPRSVMVSNIPDFHSDFVALECFDLFNAGLSMGEL